MRITVYASTLVVTFVRRIRKHACDAGTTSTVPTAPVPATRTVLKALEVPVVTQIKSHTDNSSANSSNQISSGREDQVTIGGKNKILSNK